MSRFHERDSSRKLFSIAMAFSLAGHFNYRLSCPRAQLLDFAVKRLTVRFIRDQDLLSILVHNE
jgi:hypothetical protein